jgi:hypothetical protein
MMSETYQVRHVRYGVFQGVEIDQDGNRAAVCYHPAANCPEMGFCEFKDIKAAIKFVTWALSIDSLKYKQTDLIVEPFDKEASELLSNTGVHLITIEHWMKLVNTDG